MLVIWVGVLLFAFSVYVFGFLLCFWLVVIVVFCVVAVVIALFCLPLSVLGGWLWCLWIWFSCWRLLLFVCLSRWCFWCVYLGLGLVLWCLDFLLFWLWFCIGGFCFRFLWDVFGFWVWVLVVCFVGFFLGFVSLVVGDWVFGVSLVGVFLVGFGGVGFVVFILSVFFLCVAGVVFGFCLFLFVYVVCFGVVVFFFFF